MGREATVATAIYSNLLYYLVNIDDYMGEVEIGVQAFSVCETSFFTVVDPW